MFMWLVSHFPCSQCFIEQHSRLKVYAMIVTQLHATLFQFDRAGYIYSSKINIHRDAATFVRWVLGLASDGQSAGFDPSIFWRDGARWIHTVDANNQPIECRIVDNKPWYFRRTIIGRASCLWKVEYQDRFWLIKDSWRKLGRGAEWEFLEHAKELKGVVQILSHDPTMRTISDLRGVTVDFQSDKVWSRAMLEYYDGQTLDHFEDGLQLLHAFLDIVEGSFC